RRQIVTCKSRQALGEMQSSRTGEYHGLAVIDRDLFVPFLVEVRQLAAQRRMNVVDAKLEMVPEVCHRVFEIEHHSRRSGVEHFHDKLRVVRWTGHLVALVLTPLRQSDTPLASCRLRWREMIR